MTLLLCCSVFGGFAAGLPGDAQAQPLQPLRVDPTLLGLPPVTPVKRPVKAPPGSAPVEVRAVEAPVVEAPPEHQPSAETRSAEADGGAARSSPDTAVAPVVEPAGEASATAVSPTPPLRQEATTPAPSLASPAPQPTVDTPRRQPTASSPASTAAAPAAAPVPGAVTPEPQASVPPSPAPSSESGAATSEKLAEPSTATGEGPQAAILSAKRISGIIDREVLAEDDAELRQGGKVLTAERMTYWPVDDEVEAVGGVRFQQQDDVITGVKMRMRLEDQFGFFDDASYFVKRSPPARSRARADGSAGATAESATPGSEFTSGFAAPRVLDIAPGQTRVSMRDSALKQPTEGRGDAARIDFEGENQIRLTSATYTTCKPGNDDWYLSIADLKLDFDNEVGSGNDATIHFLDVPILYSPWMSFSLNNKRKSGLLTPTYGTSSDSGIEITVPYYWNIAPNMDATFEPRVLTKRGLEIGTDVRYLNEAFGGIYSSKARLEYLPNDREAGIDRWGVALTHNQVTANGFSGAINYNRVSDNKYYTDLSSQIAKTSETQLLEQGLLTYSGGGWWNATVNLQSFQTLQPDPKNPVTPPYRLLPQVTVNARQPDLWSTDSSFFGQYTHFVHPESFKVEGQRTVLQPQVSLPYVTPGWYVTPRLGVNVTQYALSYPASVLNARNSINRSLPIFSVDSGMVFERSSNWFGRDYTQTLEPRLYYLNIPYENQNDIPVFDSALADFNFAQIFADNQFSGWDRINNANQLTAALSSRLIDPNSGSEIMRGMIGQRLYFTDDKVTLPGTSTRKWDKSDLLAGFTGQILPRVYADAALEYTVDDQRFQRYSMGARYFPETGKLLNASYSYNTQAVTPIKQIDISGQWPLGGRWQGVGRVNYSFLQNLPIEIIGGLEYNAGCWAVRVVGHRLQTAADSASTQAFVQLELTDFARIGSSPLNLLQRRISGYGVSNHPMTDSALAEQ
ncbi:MAG: LPS assembly protein LptD [Candidatus Accumulibacter sp.]|uniref:LPS assembly protein LptD n=1 Tax=Accumulibacter sp. TaxID=2053492 RepID=UPI0019E356F1|nr:LPS assembly protein LptD [Accumulibacter sp.]MBE2258432.1 LPS assembly protein LptD [Paracoccaceae bacterium]MCP5247500.1 LPS assembly protein LptD [Accumulibacter sp.]